MKELIKDYIFDPTNKNVVFNNYDKIDLERVLLITNVTDNVIIYNFANPVAGGHVVNNNILNLQYDTTTMSDTDKLQIFYEVDAVPAKEATQADMYELMYSVYTAVKDLSALVCTISGGALRVSTTTPVTIAGTPPVTIAGTPPVTISGAVAVSTISNFGVSNSNTLIPNLNNVVFQNTINNIKEV